MRTLKMLPALIALLMLLPGCVERQTPLAVGTPTITEQPKRAQEINRQLAPRCGTRGNLTPAELDALAADLEKGMAPHWNRAAAEYDRLDTQVVTCRTGRKG